MENYKGPKNYFEFSMWHAKRLPFKGERVGQAFFNDFGVEFGNSYNTVDAYEAFSLITEGLSQVFEDFWNIEAIGK